MIRTMKFFNRLGVFALLLFVAMQFAAPERVRRRVNPSQTIETITGMPADVSTLLYRPCGDCHSEKTEWRWYSNIAPFSWLEMADVGMGRDLMNLSQWSNLTPAQQQDRLKGICNLARSGDMPPWYYKPLHLSTRLSTSDVDRICEWTQAERQKLGQAR